MKRDEAVARIEALPEWQRGEYVGGELVVGPAPALPHQHVVTMLVALLVPRFQPGTGGPDGWRFVIGPELHLGEDILIPDLAGWRMQRMPSVPLTPAASLAPDWVCEVLSPSTMKFDRTAKLRAYAAAGVTWAWLVDHATRTSEVHHRAGEGWHVEDEFSGDDPVRAPPFDAAPLELRKLWPD